VLAIIFVIVVVAQPEIMLFSMASVYIASGPIGSLLKYFKRKPPEEKSSSDEEPSEPDVENNQMS
jgi:hypothetical protein